MNQLTFILHFFERHNKRRKSRHDEEGTTVKVAWSGKERERNKEGKKRKKGGEGVLRRPLVRTARPRTNHHEQ